MLLQIDWNYIQYSQEEFDRTVHTFPLHIRVLTVLALVLVMLSLIFLAFILNSRIRKTNRERRKKQLLERYTPVLQELIVGDADLGDFNAVTTLFDSGDLSKKSRREVLSEALVHMHANFSGEIASRIETVFKTLDFHRDQLDALKSKQWHVVAKGMRNLALMNIREAVEAVRPLLSHKNEVVRYEARIVTMKLSDKEHLAFLDHETTFLSDWDQANIYAMLTRIPGIDVPEFSRWLDSGNPSVVNFSIYMIGRFNQLSAMPRLIKMLQGADEQQRILIIRTIKASNYKEAEEMLIACYQDEPDHIKKEILDTLHSIATDRSAPFLEGILHGTGNSMDTLVKAARCLHTIGERGARMINELNQGKDERLKAAILHAVDPRI